MIPTYHIGILDHYLNWTENTVQCVPKEFEGCWMTWANMSFNGQRSMPPVQESTDCNLLNICLISLPQFRQSACCEKVASGDGDAVSKLVWILAYLGKAGKSTVTIPDELMNPSNNSFTAEIIDRMSMRRLSKREENIYEHHVYDLWSKHDQLLSAYMDGMAEGRARAVKKYSKKKG